MPDSITILDPASDSISIVASSTEGVTISEPSGPQGPAGPAGPTGPTGPTGPAGTNLMEISAGGSSASLSRVVFSNSNGVSFGLNGSTITASAVGGTGGGGAMSISAGASSDTLASMVFANANGISFGLGGSSITASHNALTNPAAFLASNASSNFLGSAESSKYRHLSQDTQLQFVSNNSLFTGSFLGTAASGSFLGSAESSKYRHLSADSQLQFISANSNLLGSGATVSFQHTSNSSLFQLTADNSLSLATSQSSLFRHTSADSQLLSVSQSSLFRHTSQNSQLRFTSQDSQLRFTSNAIGAVGISTAGNSAGTSGSQIGSYWFQGGNNITLSQITSNNQSHTLIISGPNTVAQSNQVLSMYAVSNTTQSSTGTQNASSLQFAGAGVASIGITGGSVVVSVPAGGGGAGTNTIGMSNIGNTAGDTAIRSGTGMQIVFAGGNNITLSQSTAGSNASITISGPNTAAQTVESNTFGMSNLGNTSGTTGVASGGQMRFLLAGGNNITLSQSINGASGTISISGPNTAAQSIQTQNMVSVNGSSGNISFANAGGVSFGFNASTVTAAAPAQTVESQSFGMSNLGNTSGTSGIASGGQVRFLLAGGNNITLSQSINGASGTISISAGGGVQSNQTLGIYGTGNVTDNSSGTFDARSLTFNAFGNLSVGVSNGSIELSGGTVAPSPTIISAGTSVGTLSSIVYSNSNLFSWGLSGSTMTGSIPGTSSLSATGAVSISTNGSTISIGAPSPNVQYFEPGDINIGLMTNIKDIQSRPIFMPFFLRGNLTNNSLILQMSRSTGGSNHFSIFAGIYTYVNSTSINLLGSTSNSYSATNTGSVSGIRYFQLTGWPTAVSAMTPGAYVLGLMFNGTQTASFNYSLFGDQTASLPVGFIAHGADQNNTTNTSLGVNNLWGRYTVGSAGLPAAVAQAHILANFSGVSAPLAPWFVLSP